MTDERDDDVRAADAPVEEGPRAEDRGGDDGPDSGRSTGSGGDPDEEPEEDGSDVNRRRVRSAVEWVAVLAGAVVVALLVRAFLFTTFWIPTGSMEPTLQGAPRKDRVVVNRLSYKLHEVNRGDIIVFSLPPGEPSMTVGGQEVQELIKRVVGLEGETISLRDGQVYVDGERLDEPYLVEGTRTEAICGESVFEIPEGSVFVMGDNRGGSRDARCWRDHSLDEDDIVGRAFFRIWPLGEMGGL